MGKKMVHEEEKEKMYEIKYDTKYYIEPQMWFTPVGAFHADIKTKAEVVIRILDSQGREVVSTVEEFEETQALENADVRSMFRDLSFRIRDYINLIEQRVRKIEENVRTFHSLVQSGSQ